MASLVIVDSPGKIRRRETSQEATADSGALELLVVVGERGACNLWFKKLFESRTDVSSTFFLLISLDLTYIGIDCMKEIVGFSLSPVLKLKV